MKKYLRRGDVLFSFDGKKVECAGIPTEVARAMDSPAGEINHLIHLPITMQELIVVAHSMHGGMSWVEVPSAVVLMAFGAKDARYAEVDA